MNKIGIKEPDQLDDRPMPDGSPTDREKFDEWNRILSTNEHVTIEDVKKFCQFQVEAIEGKWKDYSLKEKDKAQFIPYHTIYKTLLSVMNSPKAEREMLEQHLQQLLR